MHLGQFLGVLSRSELEFYEANGPLCKDIRPFYTVAHVKCCHGENVDGGWRRLARPRFNKFEILNVPCLLNADSFTCLLPCSVLPAVQQPLFGLAS
jgi:hypothetical protein